MLEEGESSPFNESQAFSQLLDNMNRSSQQSETIANIDYQRSQRAKSLSREPQQGQPATRDPKHSEWQILLNVFMFIDYNVQTPIDFNTYTFDTAIENPITPLSRIMESIDPVPQLIDNLFNKFVDNFKGKTVDLFNILKSFLTDTYQTHINTSTTETNEFNLLLQRLSITPFELLERLTNDFINRFTISFDYDVLDNSPNLLSRKVLEHVNAHYKQHVSIDLHLPSKVIDSLFNYSILQTSSQNLTTLNIPDSLKAFNTLLLSRYQTLPLEILIETSYTPHRNVQERIDLQSQVITLPIHSERRITSLEHINEVQFESETIKAKHPSIMFSENDDSNLANCLELLVQRYHNPSLLLSYYIDDLSICEMFNVASNLFNIFDFPIAINICKYLSSKFIFNGDVIQSKTVQTASTSSTSEYSIFNVDPVQPKPNVKEIEQKPSTFDVMYVKPQSVSSSIVFKLFFVITVAVIVGFLIYSYKVYKAQAVFEAPSPLEAFKLINAVNTHARPRKALKSKLQRNKASEQFRHKRYV